MDIGINKKDREKIADGLAHLLADSYTLYLKTHNFHWNVTGPMFNTLHVMFMDQYTELWNSLDMIAERVALLRRKDTGAWWVLDHKSKNQPQRDAGLVAQLETYRAALRKSYL